MPWTPVYRLDAIPGSGVAVFVLVVPNDRVTEPDSFWLGASRTACRRTPISGDRGGPHVRPSPRDAAGPGHRGRHRDAGARGRAGDLVVAAQLCLAWLQTGPRDGRHARPGGHSAEVNDFIRTLNGASS